MTDDPFRQSLADWDGEYPEAFLPKPGELLVGQLVRYERGSTTYGPADIAVILDEDSGQERSVWLLHEVLRREFQQQAPKPGERIGVKRLEDGSNSYGQRYQKWALRVDRQGGAAPKFLGEPVPEPRPADLTPEELEAALQDRRAELPDPDDDLPF